MRNGRWIGAMLVAFTLAGGAHAQQSEPEAANRALAKAFEAAWNTHDMEKGLRALLTEDNDWVNVDGGRGHGIEQVVSGHARVHQSKFKDSVMTIQTVEVALLTSDVAVMHVSWGMRGDRNNDGSLREPREGVFTWVTVKKDGIWKIRASHNSNKNVIR